MTKMDSIHIKEEIAETEQVITGSDSDPETVEPSEHITHFIDMNEHEKIDEPMEEQVHLDKLPRPVSELNCRQARTYLVKLLRTANGGLNPQYGNTAMKPPFWPNYYWPWEKLSDVHTKPRGMNEPLQYSEMMKLAISRGYQYFGYDPTSYIDTNIEEKEKFGINAEKLPPPPENVASTMRIHTVAIDEPGKAATKKVILGPPPKQPKPLPLLSCAEARVVLCKLIRYHQVGNNPNYGCPEARPPWWPDEYVRWVDMVDLRSKPAYLPEGKSYTGFMKCAIEKALTFYGYDPNTYYEKGCTASSTTDNDISNEAQDGEGVPSKTSNSALIRPLPFLIQMSCASSVTESIFKYNHMREIKPWPEGTNGPPPRLPCSVTQLNCGAARTILAKFLRYCCGNSSPAYGKLESRPSWWPSDIIEWEKIKNLSHRYEGYLGNSYSNCLRICLMRGYEYYGYDATTYVEESPGFGTDAELDRRDLNAKYPLLPELIPIDQDKTKSVCIPPDLFVSQSSLINSDNSFLLDVSLPKLPVSYATIDVGSNLSNSTCPPSVLAAAETALVKEPFVTGWTQTHLRRMPSLKPIVTMNDERPLSLYCQEKLNEHGWYPPKLLPGCEQIMVDSVTKKQLRSCKIVLSDLQIDRFNSVTSSRISTLQTNLMDELWKDCLTENIYTDFAFISDQGQIHMVHKFVLAAQSSKITKLLEDRGTEEFGCFILPGISAQVTNLLIQAMYTGQIFVPNSIGHEFRDALKALQQMGLLRNLNFCLMPINSVEESNQLQLDVVGLTPSTFIIKKEANLNSENIECANDCIDVSHNSQNCGEHTSAKRAFRNKGDVFPLKYKCLKQFCEANNPRMDLLTEETYSCKLSEGNMSFIRWLMDEVYLLSASQPKCAACGSECLLQIDDSSVDGISWLCHDIKCHDTNFRDGSIRNHSVFEGSSESISWIVKILLRWKGNTSLNECHLSTGADIEKIFYWYERCRLYFGALSDYKEKQKVKKKKLTEI